MIWMMALKVLSGLLMMLNWVVRRTSEGRATLRRDLHSLEEWAGKSSVKFNKDKYKVLHLGQKNQGSVRLGSSRTEKDMGVLVGNNQCWILDYIHRDITIIAERKT